MLTGAVAAYQIYATRDHRWLAVGALEPQFWSRFCAVIGREDLIARGLAEGDAGERTIAEVARVIRERSLPEWLAAFEGHDCCVTPVLSLAEAAHHGPVPHSGDRLFPVSLGNAALGPAPASGVDGLRIMRELGYSSERIAALAQDRALSLPAGGAAAQTLTSEQL
jgi:crotonobetainyl-CoA:carnitine CoA-transferase CaiB-like acyl-CoA transferase